MTGNSSICGSTILKRSDIMSEGLRFAQYLEKHGCYGSMVSAKHLGELVTEIRALHDEHLLADAIYTDYGGPVFNPHLPRSLPDARSIIVVATPQPMLRTTFHHEGNSYQSIVPPTYFDGHKVTWSVRRLLKEAFRPKSYRFVRALLPIKLLAVRSGLTLYGKTNVTYAPKCGSFHRLTAFYSDYDSSVDNWQEKKALALCGKCTACLDACPTGAIQKDRFLIRAERCLTYLNEKASKNKFPKWADPSSHNALIGCMRCQKACPYDNGVVNWYEDRGEFSEEETAYLLKGKFSGPKAASVEKKLKRLGLDLSIFPRNLQVLMDSQR
jgi:epoxyqueuosine reductase